MLQLVNVGQKSLADYATIATRGLMEEIRRLAEPLREAGRAVARPLDRVAGGAQAAADEGEDPFLVFDHQDAHRRQPHRKPVRMTCK